MCKYLSSEHIHGKLVVQTDIKVQYRMGTLRQQSFSAPLSVLLLRLSLTTENEKKQLLAETITLK